MSPVTLSSRSWTRLLATSALLWTALLGFSTWNGTRSSSGLAAATLSAGVYAASALLCHQRPERSFQVAEVQVPVCARCLGIYLGAAAAGLLLSTIAGGRRFSLRQGRRALALALAVNVATVLSEWAGGPDSNEARAAAGALLGAAAMWTLTAFIKIGDSVEVN